MEDFMVELIVSPEFWISRILPEGIIERWLAPDGAVIKLNDPVADLRIEGELVRLKAPAGGRLFIDTKTSSIIEPGSVIGHIDPHG
jgi:hypothetical protein